MKTIYIFLLIAFCVIGDSFAQDRPIQTAYLKQLYDRWHEVLEANPILSEPLSFDPATMHPKLSVVAAEIRKNSTDMAYFLSEKIAREYADADQVVVSLRLFRDVYLLGQVAGIELMGIDDIPVIEQDLGANIAQLVPRFSQEWRAGTYEDPSDRVRALCDARLGDEAAGIVDPLRLVEIRRYGMFGLPELIRQIKEHNSSHAFAAYLVMTGNDDYVEYIKDTRQRFSAREEKLAHIADTVARIKEGGAKDLNLLERLDDALREER